ncbi:uncharacterized protein LOC125778485 [Bactrocera dorsalis]|uniref:Uncharacterized protein LOC125778485 n=2 Tax=Bactrocera dorsalis TaxID=27457 RepID=A0ABM3JTL9_BACDO|nr:uncharacterized protein LOC125778485 [Bactrocera dorsalis]
MKLLFITLSAILGNFAIAAVLLTTAQPPTEIQSVESNLYLNKLQSKSHLVRELKTDLQLFKTDKKLSDETEKLNDYSATYSSKVQTLVSGIRPLILTFHDSVVDAISGTYEWCSSADILLDAVLKTFVAKDTELRYEVLHGLFDVDFAADLVSKLKKATDTLHSASDLVSNILSEFDSDLIEQSPLFEVLLRQELLNDENKRYSRGLINTLVTAMKKYIKNPELLQQELSSTKLVDAVGSLVSTHVNQRREPRQLTNYQQYGQHLNNQQQEPRQLTNYQQYGQHLNNQQQEPRQLTNYQQYGQHLNNQQKQSTTEQTTANAQLYVQYRDRVLAQFQLTKNFFNDYKRTIDSTISSIDELEAKVLRKNQQSSPNNRGASTDNLLKNAARALKTDCKQFTTSQLYA